MTLDRLKKQKEFFQQQLLEKGISLIRTFEAGTRTGMMTMQWGAQRIQTMLQETSLQPEVLYIAITSKDGTILAHSDTSMLNKSVKAMPDSKSSLNNFAIYHRTKQYKGQNAFEVYKRFEPVKRGFQKRHQRMHEHMMRNHARNKDLKQSEIKKEKMDWINPYIKLKQNKTSENKHYIFTGLSMEKGEKARTILLKNTIINTILFFVLGCAGIFALLTFQAYNNTKASLKSIKAFSNNIIQNMPAGLVTIDCEYKITSMNQAAKDILGKNFKEPFPQMIKLINKIKTLQKPVQKQIDLIDDDNNTLNLDIIASLIADNENKTIGFLFLFRDLTQIKHLENKVQTNKRLAAIGKLAGGVAHEIRNPLSSIKGFATYFAKRYENNTQDKETADIMISETNRINQSITQLLEFAKPMSIKKKEFNINELITHSIKLMQNDFDKKQIQTFVNINIKNETFYTDPDRLHQVLLNLYINAAKALPKKGRLKIDINNLDNKNYIEMAIEDNGEGIDKNNIDLIFDPYFTTSPVGTGLGLSIVYKIIDGLKGSIRVKSTKNKGTCFVIHLPVYKQA